LCKGDWSKHGSSTGGYYACNVYESVKADAKSSINAEERSAEEARARLRRYQWHFDRTAAYQQSISAAEKLIPITERRMEDLQMLTHANLAEVEFLLDANKTVLECRRALKWSYVIAYYLVSHEQQRGMERAVRRCQMEAHFSLRCCFSCVRS
jgi:ariadne-1